VNTPLTRLYRRFSRALGVMSILFGTGLAMSLAGVGWVMSINRAAGAMDARIMADGGALAQDLLVAERSYERFLMTGERQLVVAHREADAGILKALDRLEALARELAPWDPGLPGRVRGVRDAVGAWRTTYVEPALESRLKHLWHELEIFHSNRGEAAWVTRLDSAIATLRSSLHLAADQRRAAMTASHTEATSLLAGGLVIQLVALLVLIPAVIHGLGTMRDRAKLSVSLMDAAELIHESPDGDAVAHVLTMAAVQETGAATAVVLLERGATLAEASVAGRTGPSPGSAVLDQPSLCPVVSSGAPHLVTTAGQARRCHCPLGAPATGGYACFPLTSRSRVNGVFNVQLPRRTALRAEHLQDHFSSLARIASMALNGQHVLAQAQRQAMTDPLTGAYNRRYFEAVLIQHVHSAHRRSAPLSLLMLDLDLFKGFNDTHGHQAGDALLEVFGHVAKDTLRGEDLFARYGGEEFVALLPDTNKEASRLIAERIRERVRNMFVPNLAHLHPPLISVSIGVSAYPDDGATGEELLQSADRALYRAKDAGRDRVLTA